MAERIPVSAVVVSYKTRELTLAAVGSLVDFLPQASDVWVVDNASGDGSVAALRERWPDVEVVELPDNIGFGRANNVAMERSRGDYILLLNSDARLTGPDVVPRMIERFHANGRLGVVGPRLENPSGALEYSARAFPTLAREAVRRFGLYLLLPRASVGAWLLGDFWSPTEPTDVDWVTGACMLVRREAYEDVGGFDPSLFMYGEEQEWCRRLKARGWEVLYDPTVAVVHARAASGPAGPWRLRAALEADVTIYRRVNGRLRAIAFNLVRTAGLLTETIAFGLAAGVRKSDYLRRRAIHSRDALGQQLRVFLRRPAG